MIPLDMKGMIRYCHPPTPMVGLYRQSGCPIKTREAYNKARLERDMACLPSMLHQMVSRFKAYRATRRLWIQAIHTMLAKGLFCNYLTHCIMGFLTSKHTEYLPPLIYCPIMRYELKTIRQRFVQMSGRLVSLGYRPLVLPPIQDFEYEIYLSLCSTRIHPEVTDLYQQLERKKVPNKWRIMFSYLDRLKSNRYDDVYELPIYEMGDRWESYCNKKKIYIYLDKCLKLNTLTGEQEDMIDGWLSYMKYPMY